MQYEVKTFEVTEYDQLVLRYRFYEDRMDEFINIPLAVASEGVSAVEHYVSVKLDEIVKHKGKRRELLLQRMDTVNDTLTIVCDGERLEGRVINNPINKDLYTVVLEKPEVYADRCTLHGGSVCESMYWFNEETGTVSWIAIEKAKQALMEMYRGNKFKIHHAPMIALVEKLNEACLAK